MSDYAISFTWSIELTNIEAGCARASRLRVKAIGDDFLLFASHWFPEGVTKIFRLLRSCYLIAKFGWQSGSLWCRGFFQIYRFLKKKNLENQWFERNFDAHLGLFWARFPISPIILAGGLMCDIVLITWTGAKISNLFLNLPWLVDHIPPIEGFIISSTRTLGTLSFWKPVFHTLYVRLWGLGMFWSTSSS